MLYRTRYCLPSSPLVCTAKANERLPWTPRFTPRNGTRGSHASQHINRPIHVDRSPHPLERSKRRSGARFPLRRGRAVVVMFWGKGNFPKPCAGGHRSRDGDGLYTSRQIPYRETCRRLFSCVLVPLFALLSTVPCKPVLPHICSHLSPPRLFAIIVLLNVSNPQLKHAPHARD